MILSNLLSRLYGLIILLIVAAVIASALGFLIFGLEHLYDFAEKVIEHSK